MERTSGTIVARQLLDLISELVRRLHVRNVALLEVLETLLSNLVGIHVFNHVGLVVLSIVDCILLRLEQLGIDQLTLGVHILNIRVQDHEVAIGCHLVPV